MEEHKVCHNEDHSGQDSGCCTYNYKDNYCSVSPIMSRNQSAANILEQVIKRLEKLQNT